LLWGSWRVLYWRWTLSFSAGWSPGAWQILLRSRLPILLWTKMRLRCPTRRSIH